ncbi:zinc-dependent alcohol dehydrogenase [Autumnicola psychrophila]|uniref:Alcohol dehydrogenase catalytic domain-containing protein n=1 Tax=Autumnicola psychrophila TaxID=3075592 RepID=A0ABU3DMP3_9FLAO|nr:zinc-binding dehydrogenase [Zunongwangia sp. F225]MDT0684986.1 alcohol dehydrogenase catalytic domain-containing protein [Zunongwangia sp. F225]
MSIPTKMNALVLKGVRDFNIESVPVPGIDSDEVLCKVDTTYICGTDPHIIAGDFPDFWPTGYPFIPGHEWSGTIVKTGEKASVLGWNNGDRVCGISHCGCGYCEMCLKGRYNICLNYGHEEKGHRQYGHYTPGAYAQYMRSSVKSIFKVPDSMSLEYAACVDPLSIALYTVERSRMKPGDDILILGTGPQGLMAILCAKALGAGRIIAAGSGERLKKAEELGAIPINYKEEDVVSKVEEMTNGNGVPSVLECAGTVKSIRQACLAASKGGVVSVIGIPHADPSLPLKRIVLDEIELVGNRANPNTARRTIELLANSRIDLTPLMTHKFSLKEFDSALDTFENRRNGAIKIATKPNG